MLGHASQKVDVIAASYYDNTIRWFENQLGDTVKNSKGEDVPGDLKKAHIVTTSANNAQGVFAADLDGDGDLDLATASSGGDGEIAVCTCQPMHPYH